MVLLLFLACSTLDSGSGVKVGAYLLQRYPLRQCQTRNKVEQLCHSTSKR